MDTLFELDIEVDGEIFCLECRMQTWGYSYRIIAVVNEVEVIFEPDEERKYRVIILNNDLSALKSNDLELIQAAALKLESIQ